MAFDYWSPRHLNHHTEATSMQYAVHEALRCIILEGLQERFARHALNDKALCAGLQAMGLKIFGDLKHKMPCVTAICIPEGIDGPTLRGQALRDFGIEMATSFGPLDGKIIHEKIACFSIQHRQNCAKRNKADHISHNVGQYRCHTQFFSVSPESGDLFKQMQIVSVLPLCITSAQTFCKKEKVGQTDQI